MEVLTTVYGGKQQGGTILETKDKWHVEKGIMERKRDQNTKNRVPVKWKIYAINITEGEYKSMVETSRSSNLSLTYKISLIN